MRALRLVALVETVSFALLLGCSVLKRTTSFNAVPVMGPVHGVLFLVLVALVLHQRDRLAWSVRKTALALTVGSPFAHFFVRSTP
ncbi:MAG: rane protein [Frankiales bacterium]|nr:rane protein [Frankiales bacterium]